MFAATPPLEAIKMLLTKLASSNGELELLHMDVSRAYMHARATRELYIEIPEEMKTKEDIKRDYVGRLNVSLYGTRDGAANWEKEYVAYLQELGLQPGQYTPCAFRDRHGKLSGVVHGDDFIFVGESVALDRLEKAMRRKYPVKCQRLGAAHETEIVILNRKVRWGKYGVQYMPDDKHATAVVSELGVHGASWSGAPGSHAGTGEPKGEQRLSPAEAKSYRSNIARLNYMALHRPDIGYSVKEVARAMACPTQNDKLKLKKIAIYI